MTRSPSVRGSPDTPRGETPEPHPELTRREKKHVEKQLDHGLDETFPASDPVSIQPGAD